MRATRTGLVALVVAVVTGCSIVSEATSVINLASSPYSIDSAALSADGQSVVVTLVGAHEMSSDAVCAGAYDASGHVDGSVVYVSARQTAARNGDCALTELICCEYDFTIPIPEGRNVTVVSDAGHPNNPILFLERPPAVRDLVALPPGWTLGREQPEWGGTWRQTYAAGELTPYVAPESRLEYETRLDGSLATKPAVTTVTKLDSPPGQVAYYSDTNEVVVGWLVGGARMRLTANADVFSAEQLIHIVEATWP